MFYDSITLDFETLTNLENVLGFVILRELLFSLFILCSYEKPNSLESEQINYIFTENQTKIILKSKL